MTHLPLVLAVALVTYLTRLAGLALGARTLPPALDRFLSYIPVAAFAALVAQGLANGNATPVPRLIAAATVVLVVVRWRQLGIGWAAGIASYWLTELAVRGIR